MRDDLAGDVERLKFQITKLEHANAELAKGEKAMSVKANEHAKHAKELKNEVSALQRDNDDMHTEQHKLKKSLQKREQDLRGLQEQVIGYKRIITSSSRSKDQVADDVIEAQAGQIYFDLNGAIRRLCRNVELRKSAFTEIVHLLRVDVGSDYDGLPEVIKRWCVDFIPNINAMPSRNASRAVTAIASKILCSRFGTKFYFGASTEGAAYAAAQLATLKCKSESLCRAPRT